MVYRALVFSVAVLFLWHIPGFSQLRDPFLPAGEPCLPAIYGWRIGGIVQGPQDIVFVQIPGSGWRRFALGESLVSGWEISAISSSVITLNGGAPCPLFSVHLENQGFSDAKNHAVYSSLGG